MGSAQLQAQRLPFDFNDRCREAYDLIFSLRLEEGKSLLAEEIEQNPDNRIPYFLQNYADFFVCYIDEEEAVFSELYENKSDRLSALKEGDRDSPFYRYTQAEVHLQWAMARLKFEEYVGAFRDVRKAFKLLEENKRKFPEFRANDKSLGLLHGIIGAIPDQYKWGVKIVGLDGDIEQGMAEMRALLKYASEEDFIFEQETLVYYSLMALYLANDQEEAWNGIDTRRLELEDHLLNHFIAASVAMRTGRNDYAIEVLEKRPSGPEYHPFSYCEFMLGLAKLRRLDSDADQHLKKFAREFPGRNYLREAYQKLGWHYLIRGQQNRYREMMELSLERGVSVIDDDKQAEAEARSSELPNEHLLRARLLFDGGYYERAIEALDEMPEEGARLRDQVEEAYRRGRIFHASEDYDKAIPAYKSALNEGAELPYFFAANAALQLGHIFEEKGDFDQAEYYFKQCLKLKDHEYRTSISSKAKAGLNRIDR